MHYGLLNDIRPLDKELLDQIVKHFSYLGFARSSDECRIYYPKLYIDADNTQRCLAESGLDPDRFTMALLPGAEYVPAKQWPVDHCADLVRQIDQAGGADSNLCSNTQIAGAVDLITQADLAVTNNSGLMHVAAVKTRVIAIYGSSSPNFTPPL